MVSSRKSRPPGSERKGSIEKELGCGIHRKAGRLEKIFFGPVVDFCEGIRGGAKGSDGMPWLS